MNEKEFRAMFDIPGKKSFEDTRSQRNSIAYYKLTGKYYRKLQEIDAIQKDLTGEINFGNHPTI